MNIKVRVSALVAGVVLLALTVFAWRFIDLQNSLQNQRTSEFLRLQSNHASQVSQLLSRNYRLQLIDLISEEQTARRMAQASVSEEVLNANLVASPFLGTVLLKMENQKWKVATSRIRGNWHDSFLASMTDQIPLAKVQEGVTLWARILDPSSQPIFAIAAIANDGKEDVIAIGLLPTTAMSQVAQAFLNSSIEMILFDDLGFAFSNTESAYVGAPMADAYPGVAESFKRNEISGDWVTKNRFKQPVNANSLKVEGTNLYVLTQSSTTSSWAFVPRMLIAMSIFAFAICMIGIGLGIWVASPLDIAIRYLSTQIFNIGNGLPVTMAPIGNPYLDLMRDDIDKLIIREDGTGQQVVSSATQSRMDSEKMGAYKEVSVGLAQALKEPLALVLAQAQLARSKASADEVKDHFVVIEREARKARDTVDNLLRLNTVANSTKSRLDSQEIILGALAAQKGLISSHNVKVLKTFQAGSMLMGNAGQIQTAIEEVLKNAVEATREKADREIRVQTLVKDKNVEIIIEDNGSGISSEKLAKVFDPFFTSKDSDQHKGLGLTVAKGIAKGQGGKVRIESVEGEKTRVIFEFPLAGARAGKFEIEEKPLAASDLALQKPLTGTEADVLPTPPAIDEVTFSGIHDATEVLSENQGDVIPMRSPRLKEQQT